MQHEIITEASAHAERDLKTSMLRGWRRECPSCGSGPLMQGYLTVRHRCAVCGEELHHHRADDGPAWATILIAGLIMAPLMFFVFVSYHPAALVMAVGFSAAFTVFALYLLPRIKGVFVGIQWARRMHGFADTPTA